MLEKIEIASILVVLPTRNRGIVDMLAIFSLFVQQVLLTGGFKASALPAKIYRALLTAAEQLTNQPIVLFLSPQISVPFVGLLTYIGFEVWLEICSSLPQEGIAKDTGCFCFSGRQEASDSQWLLPCGTRTVTPCSI